MSKKDCDSVDNSRLIELVQEYCISNQFEAEFEAFAREHSGVFMRSLDFSTDTTEHPLEFHDVYRKYLSKFEGLIERFITQNGFTLGQFYDQCKEIIDHDDAFGSKRFFIETMLATSEYENFFLLMKGEMREQQAAARRQNHK